MLICVQTQTRSYFPKLTENKGQTGNFANTTTARFLKREPFDAVLSLSKPSDGRPFDESSLQDSVVTYQCWRSFVTLHHHHTTVYERLEDMVKSEGNSLIPWETTYDGQLAYYKNMYSGRELEGKWSSQKLVILEYRKGAKNTPQYIMCVGCRRPFRTLPNTAKLNKPWPKKYTPLVTWTKGVGFRCTSCMI